MSKTAKIMFILMFVVIAFLGCALISVAVTLGDANTAAPAEVYEAPALATEVEVVADPATPTTAPEPAESHPLGWSAADEAEALAYSEKSLVLLNTWLSYLDDAQAYNNTMVADPTVIYDVGWTMGYSFVMDDWTNLADECLAWPVPIAPMSEVDYLTKQSCTSWKLSARALQVGLDGLPDDIDGLIYQLGVSVDYLNDANRFMGQSSDLLEEITIQMGG